MQLEKNLTNDKWFVCVFVVVGFGFFFTILVQYSFLDVKLLSAENY